jgi:tetratricopeptide (TPR) repeat protein
MSEYTDLGYALNAVHDHRFKEAVPVLERLVDAEPWVAGVAAYTLGILSENGFGVPKDEQKAIEYYSLSQDADYEMATYRLASIYQRRGDFAEALRYFQMSSQSNPSAAYWCYRILLENPVLRGQEADVEDHLSLAISQGHILAKKVQAFRKLKGNHGLKGIFAGLHEVISTIAAARIAVKNDDKLKYT